MNLCTCFHLSDGLCGLSPVSHRRVAAQCGADSVCASVVTELQFNLSLKSTKKSCCCCCCCCCVFVEHWWTCGERSSESDTELKGWSSWSIDWFSELSWSDAPWEFLPHPHRIICTHKNFRSMAHSSCSIQQWNHCLKASKSSSSPVWLPLCLWLQLRANWLKAFS